MNPIRFRIFTASTLLPLIVAMLALSCAPSSEAKPVPDNLANGLDKIVENNLIQQGQITAPAPAVATSKPGKSAAARRTAARAAANSISTYNAMVAKDAAMYAQAAITETATGKYLVDIMPDSLRDPRRGASRRMVRRALHYACSSNTSVQGP